jgi:GNAT superfamily N-acetyltransferase
VKTETVRTKIEIVRKNFRTLSKLEYAYLQALTLSEYTSGMNTAIREARDYPDYYDNSWSNSSAFIAIDADGTWLGWCLGRTGFPYNRGTKSNSYMIFVKPEWRRFGIGKALLKAATDHYKTQNDLIHECFPWDRDSHSFFSDAGKKIDIFSNYSGEKMGGF